MKNTKTAFLLATILARWSARMLSAFILLFWGFFIVANLVGGDGGSSRPLTTDDYVGLATMLISLLGLVLAWKWELVGGAATLVPYLILAAVNPNVLDSPFVLFPVTALLFLSSGWMRRGLQGHKRFDGDSMKPGKNSRMKRMTVRVFLGVLVTPALIAGVCGGCTPMSIREQSKSAGFNGSFELEKSGMPVNWYIHYPPIKNKDAEVSLDTTTAVDGKQSLKFVVHRVTPGGGWRSAGFFQVTPAKPKHTYQLTFWLKNQGSKISLFVRSEKPKVSPPPRRMILAAGETGTNTWRQFECVYTVPEGYHNIRFELGMLQPGVVWIDDVRIQEMPND